LKLACPHAGKSERRFRNAQSGWNATAWAAGMAMMKPRPWNLLQRKNLFFAAYLIFATAALVLLVEIALWGVDLVTGGKLPPLCKVYYPPNPKDYLKIAIVGESAAMGFNAEYGFKDVLFYELDRRFNGALYIRNYAREGLPFQGQRAKVVKENIHRYDIFLIYAGHNEVHNYIDRVGKFRKPQFKKYRMFEVVPGDGASLGRRILDGHSRIYALLWRHNQHSLDATVEKAKGWKLRLHFDEFMPEGVLPPDEREKIDTNFRNDLEEIGQLAQEHNKQVILMSAPSCEDWKPMFSVCNRQLSKSDSDKWWNEYRQGESCYQGGHFSDALAHFQVAHAIDGGVAILNYRMGMSLGHLGRLAESHKYLRLAIDTDGFPVRALNSLFTIEESNAARFPNVHYCNMVETFEGLVDRGCQWSELFADFQHPSFAGHVVIAHSFLSKLAEIKSFSYQSPDLDSRKLSELVTLYHKEFGFSPTDQAKTAKQRVMWASGAAEISAYPEDFFALAEKNLQLFYESIGKGSEGEQAYRDGKTLIQIRRDEWRTNR
jgi:hypothetical protein